MSKNEFENIIGKINNIWLTKYIRTTSLSKEHIYALAKDINNLDNISNVEIGNCSKINFKDFDGDSNFIYEYPILIEINNIKINGKIRLIPAGDLGYNIVLCLRTNSQVLESLTLNEEFSIKSFIKELKQCKSFEDIKHVFKKYAVEATLIGSLLAIILCNFNLSDSQVRELGYINDSNVVQAEQFYIYDEDTQKKEEKPEWKLLCNDTEITVYHAKESQCNSDIQHTASMFKLDLKNPESHRIIAMERSMMKQYGLKYGDIVKIEGTDSSRDGIYQIQDTMNKRFKGKHKVDILINNNSKIGKWNNAKIYKLTNPKEFYNFLKKDMANALNQSSINRRQNQNL